jgi:hypothetical protein
MILNSPYISGSLTVTGNATIQGSISGTITGSATSASLAQTASSVANLNQNVQITGSLTTNGTITAQTLVVQTVTSSVVYSSGSNIFGNSQSNVQQMTGSLRVTGSFVQSGANTTSSFAGLVGVGTTSPVYNMDINGTLRATGITTLGGQIVSSNGSMVLQTNASDTVSTGNFIGFGAGGGTTSNNVIQGGVGKLMFFGYNGSSWTTPLSISNSTGAATFSGSIEGTIINSTSNAFRLNGNNALSLVSLNSQSVVKINAAGFWGVQLVGANDQGILITNTGNTLIGTTTDNGNKLQVNGSITNTGNITNSSNNGASTRTQYGKAIPASSSVTFTFTAGGGNILGFNIIIGGYGGALTGWLGGTISGGGYMGYNSTIYTVNNNVTTAGALSVSISKGSNSFDVTITNSANATGQAYVTLDTTGDGLTIS